MAPIIRAVLSNLIGEEDSNAIEIVSNEAEVHADGTWSIKYRHPTRCVVPPPECYNICRLTSDVPYTV